MKRWILLGSMLLSHGSIAADTPGSADLPEVTRPLGSEIIRYSEECNQQSAFLRTS